MRKVTSEEIDQLYIFTRQHYVEYYDVQTELVDHLASAIEENWKESPEFSFEENLNKEFKKFGIFGFSDIVEKRAAAMEKKYLKLILTEIFNLLKKPAAILSAVFLFLGAYFLMSSELGYTLLTCGILLMYFFHMIFMFRMGSKLEQKKKKEKIYLLEEIILKSGGIFVLFLFPFLLMNSLSSTELSGNPVMQVFIAFLISAVALMSYTCLIVLPGKKDEILKKAFPV